MALTVAGALLVVTLIGVAVGRTVRQAAANAVERTGRVRLGLAELAVQYAELDIELVRSWPQGDRLSRLHAQTRALEELSADDARQQASLATFGRVLDQLEQAPQDIDAVHRFHEGRRLLEAMSARQAVVMASQVTDERRWSTHVWGALGLSFALSVGFAFSALRRLSKQEAELGHQLAYLRSILESTGDAVVAIDTQRRFLIANSALRQLFGEHVAGAELDLGWSSALDARTEEELRLQRDQGPLIRALRGESVDAFRFSMNVIGREDRVWLSSTARPVVDSNGQVIAAVAVVRDVTESKSRELLLARQAEQLRQQSLIDELTRLYNRRGFTVLSEQYLRTARRTQRPFAVVFADLDGLKLINDELGHDYGDQAIRRMAAILKSTAREADIVARLGGDEYVVLLDGADEASAARFAQRLADAVVLDRTRDPPPYTLSVSIGCAAHEAGDQSSLDELLSRADQAMYANKKQRRESAPERA